MYILLKLSLDESTQRDNWFMPTEYTISTGVAIRVDNDFFRVFPYENPILVPFEAAVRGLNPVVAVKLRSSSVLAAMAKVSVYLTNFSMEYPKISLLSSEPHQDSIYIDQNTRIQILENINQLPIAEKDQCGAFIVRLFLFTLSPKSQSSFFQRDEGSLILWSYALESIIPLCKDFDEKLIKHIWRTRKVARRSTFVPPSTAASTNTNASSASGSQAELNPSTTVNEFDEKVNLEVEEKSLQVPPPAPKKSWWSWRLQPPAPQSSSSSSNPPGDPEKGPSRKKPRKLVLLGPLYAGCGAALAMCSFPPPPILVLINLIN